MLANRGRVGGMAIPILSESIWARGWADTKRGIRTWQFWALEVFGGGLLAIFSHPLVGLVFVAGVVAAIWIGATVRAPFEQRDEARRALRSGQPRLVLVCRGIERQDADVNRIRFVIKNEDGGATAKNLRVTFKLPPDIRGDEVGRGWMEERIQDTFEPNGRVAVATSMYNEIEGLAGGAYTQEFFGLFIPVESYPNGASVSLKYRMDAEGMEPLYDQIEATVKLDG